MSRFRDCINKEVIFQITKKIHYISNNIQGKCIDHNYN